MCRGCCNQLFLRDEFHRGGIADLLRELASVPTRRGLMAYSVGAASALTGVGTAAFAADEGADLILRGGDGLFAAGCANLLGPCSQTRQGACGWRREQAVGA